MSDQPLFRNGKVVLKVRDLPDGSKMVFKPFIIREEHVMRLTGAPGWDKQHVDAVFTEGVTGGLRYIEDIVQYDITIDEFREHAFERAIDSFGSQYHVHKKYYKSTGLRTVSPRREEAEQTIELPSKITFGEWVPCTSCSSTGTKDKKRCGKCQGIGYLKWTSSSAT